MAASGPRQTTEATHGACQPRGCDAHRARWRDSSRILTATLVPKRRGGDRSHSPDSIDDLVNRARRQLIAGTADLSIKEKRKLAATIPDAFRRNFGMEAMAHDIPLDVLQRILGHQSLQTTTIDVQAKHQRAGPLLC
jgi:integrase